MSPLRVTLLAIQKGGHHVLDQLARLQPHVGVLVPVLILGRAQFVLNELSTCLTVLVQVDSVFQVPPTPINDLCAGLDLQGATSRELVQGDFHVFGAYPSPLSIGGLDSLLLVHDFVVDHTVNAQLVGLRAVRVEHNAPILQVLLPYRGPFHLPNGPGSGRSLAGHLRSQAHQNQGLWNSSLHNAAPLLPHDAVVALDKPPHAWHFADVSLVERRLIRLHVKPAHTITKPNGSLNRLHILPPSLRELLAHVLDRLVVHSHQLVDLRLFDVAEVQQEHSSLDLKAVTFRSFAFRKERVHVMRVDVLLALPVAAAMHPCAAPRPLLE